MAQNLTFNSTVSTHTESGLELRGQSLQNLVAEADFVSTLYLSLTGKKPTAPQKKLLNAILVASIDHGVEPASGFVPRVAASTGNDMLTCMATVPLVLGPRHGGAITDCMLVLHQIIHSSDKDIEKSCLQLVTDYRANKKRVPGYGHPHYTNEDPRTTQLFNMAQQAGLDQTALNTARTLETTLESKTGRKLILNVDGAIAALLLAMELHPESGNALFALARIAGSIAHIIEEKVNDGGVRRL